MVSTSLVKKHNFKEKQSTYKTEIVFFHKLKSYYQAKNEIVYFKEQASAFSSSKSKELRQVIVKSLNRFNIFAMREKIGNIKQELEIVNRINNLQAEIPSFDQNLETKISEMKKMYMANRKARIGFFKHQNALRKFGQLKYRKVVKNKYNQKTKIYDAIQGYFFISPSILLLSIFMLFSIGFGVFMSLNKVKVTGLGLVYTFVGFDQYEWLFKSKAFAYSLRITLLYMVMVAPAQTILSLILSSILATKIKGRKIFIVLYFLPTLTSSTALTLIFLRLFGTGGPIGTFLGENFVNENILALVAIMNIWTSIPYFMTIYNAAHAEIPKSQYEAASIDGASGFKKFWKITVPHLKLVTAFVLLTSIIWTLQVFDQLYIIGKDPTLAIPSKELTSTATWIYNMAFGSFRHQDFGRAAAGSIVLAAIIFVFSFASNFLSRERR